MTGKHVNQEFRLYDRQKRAKKFKNISLVARALVPLFIIGSLLFVYLAKFSNLWGNLALAFLLFLLTMSMQIISGVSMVIYDEEIFYAEHYGAQGKMKIRSKR